MKRFGKVELVEFIRAIDRNLSEPVSVLVIGGAAASVAYDSGMPTSDIDVYNILKGSTSTLAEAFTEAQQETGLGVGIGSGSVGELPYNYEDRVSVPRGLNLKKLTLLVPDKYDLALSKTMRGYPHDIDAIEGIHEHHRLSEKVLLQRFEDEFVKQVVGDEAKVRLNMAMVVARLYGMDEARRLAKLWNVPTPI